MSININVLQQYAQQININSTGKVAQSALPNAAEVALGSMETGDMFACKVMEASSDGVLLRLDNGVTFAANNLTDSAVHPGDTLTLLVSQSASDQVSLRLVSTTPDPARLLSGLGEGFGGDSQLLAAVTKAFDDANIPIQPQLAQQVLEALASHPQLTAAKALFLAMNDIPMEQPQIDALAQLVDDKMLTGQALSTIAQALETGTPENTVQQAAPQELPQTQPQTPEALTQNPIPTTAQATHAAPADTTALMDAVRLKSPVAAGFVALVDMAQEMGEMVERTSHMPAAQQNAAVDAFVAQLPSTLGNARQALSEALHEAIQQTRESIQNQPIPQQAISPQETAAIQPQLLREPTLADRVHDLFAKLDAPQAQGKELQESLMEIKEQLTALRTTLMQQGNTPVIRQVEQALQRQQLMEDVHQYIYAQIPFVLQGQERTGELYVMKRDKRKGAQLDVENVTMLIALETEHIGRIESLIKVEQKNVTIQFRVSDMERAQALKPIMSQLKEMLEGVGYQLQDTRMLPISTPVTPLNVASVVAKEYGLGERLLDVKV